MTNAITLIDVRNTLKARDLDLVNPANVTQHAAQAKVIAITLTAKKNPGKQLLDAVKTHLTTLWGDQHPEGQEAGAGYSEVGEDGVERFDDENTAGQDELNDQLDAEGEFDDQTRGLPISEANEQGDPLGSIEDEAFQAEGASEEGEDGEGETKVDRSVVKGKYRAEYKARGDARICGDWLSVVLKGLVNGTKRKLDMDCFIVICGMNGTSEKIAQYTTAEKRASNGWQGRARMSGRLAMEQVIARENNFQIPRSVWDEKRVDLMLEKAGLSRVVFELEDDVVNLLPPSDWTRATLAKRPGVNKDVKGEAN